ncbi:hypothetical protein D1AOALGA4SA_458 [Olavius algarvensis Delta 1 endosymbiont]|nr:hypothetical protein D1AOALGA4SA_458 [Olavius algarvensis Delta 1 endosymbiont]
MTEDRRQKTEVRCQRADVRGQMSEVQRRSSDGSSWVTRAFMDLKWLRIDIEFYNRYIH